VENTYKHFFWETTSTFITKLWVFIKLWCQLEMKKWPHNGTCFSIGPQALVSFKKYMLPPLPYFKVNICPFPLPQFASYFSLICDLFADPIIPLHSRDISLYDCHIYIYLPGPPQTNWTRISANVACFIFKTLKRIQPLPVRFKLI
jgi:hypothetical protein